jgi:hypothetical protein
MYRKWDKGLDFQTEYNRLRGLITNPPKKFIRLDKQVKLAILFIQLRNGGRLHEAIYAYNEFSRGRQREVQVKVEKRKDPYLRMFIIPPEIREGMPEFVQQGSNLSHFAEYHLGYNPHSLRYAFITYLGKKGVSPQVLSKITGHKTLSMIMDYTQEQAGADILRDIAG